MSRKEFAFKFASGSAVSDAHWISPAGLTNLLLPTGLQGEYITFQAAALANGAALDGNTVWQDCVDRNGNALTIRIRAGSRPCLLPEALRGLGHVRLKAIAATGADQTQGAARTVYGYSVAGLVS